jgi:hypothetical protein
MSAPKLRFTRIGRAYCYGRFKIRHDWPAVVPWGGGPERQAAVPDKDAKTLVAAYLPPRSKP